MSFLLFEIPNFIAKEALFLKRIFLFAPPYFREMYYAVVFCAIARKYDAS
jgi:hypothetical protein